MKAIILVAGRGERLYPLTKETPKCLISVGKQSILEHQLWNLKANGIKDVVLVTGFRADKIEKAVDEMNLYDMNIKFIHNPFYDVSNNLFSLSMALGEMDGDFMIINGDDVFHPEILQRLIHADKEQITLMINIKDSYDSDDMKVSIANEKITQVNKIMKSDDANGESIGIMKFSGPGVEKMHKMIFKMANSPEGKKDWYLKAIQNIAKEDNIVGFADVGNLPWGEIDFPEDLSYVKNTVMRQIESVESKVMFAAD